VGPRRGLVVVERRKTSDLVRNRIPIFRSSRLERRAVRIILSSPYYAEQSVLY
jgi:hypothetical protein